MNALSTNARIARTKLTLEGMDCSDCELVLEHRLRRLDGVLEVSANFGDQSLKVTYDESLINRRGIEKRVRQMGYDPIPGVFIRWLLDNRALAFSLISGLLLLFGWLAERAILLPVSASTALYIAAFLPAGYDVGRESLRSLKARHFDTDILMFAAALGAASLGALAEGVLLIFLFALGHALQGRALEHARRSVRSLGELAPRMAVVRRGSSDHVLPVEKLTLDDIVVVRPGERMPVDGVIVKGASYVNEAPITGESIPVEKSVGNQVFAGSLNSDGTLEVQASRLAKDSTLARVMKLVEQAQATRSPTQLWVDRFTRVFVPVVLFLTAGLMVYPLWMGEPFSQGFLRAVTFLVAASPCALALGTPSAVLAGIAQAARSGVLVKGGVILENLGRLRAIAFDKTGTLTLGEPRLTDVLFVPGWTETGVLSLAASVEGRSNHPLAQAISHRAGEMKILVEPAEDVENIAGRGMRARINDKTIWIGGATLFREQGFSLPPEWQPHIQRFEAQGKTILFARVEDQAVGLFAVSDAIRPESARALAGLARLGLTKTVMLSGDNPRAAASIAADLGLAEFRADLSPEEKLKAIDKLVETYKVVGMVGDGVNDAPALAQASVGIALGSARNDIALEAADVALMSPDLTKIPFAISLGRAVQHITIQNLAISLGSIVLLSVLGLSGTISIGMTVFFHEGATLLVVANALRLLAFQGPSAA